MKFVVIFFTLLGTACASNHFVSDKEALGYETVRQFVIGQTTKIEVIKALGQPGSKGSEKNTLIFHYNDPQTDAQRLSLAFSPDSGRLMTLLWIPKEGEPESSLKGARAGFQQASFKEVLEKHENPHDISQAGIQYIDEESGVTIRYNQNEGIVEAIAIYNKESRIPAESHKAQEKGKKVNYTFGDEAFSQR